MGISMRLLSMSKSSYYPHVHDSWIDNGRRFSLVGSALSLGIAESLGSKKKRCRPTPSILHGKRSGGKSARSRNVRPFCTEDQMSPRRYMNRLAANPSKRNDLAVH